MKVPHIVGADLSKKNIDFACLPSQQYLKTSNDPAGFKQLHKWLKEQHIAPSQLMVVMEHTGLYSYQLERSLRKEQIPFCKVAGLAVKRSMGIIRGKNDKIDAYRLARYGLQQADRWTPSFPLMNTWSVCKGSTARVNGWCATGRHLRRPLKKCSKPAALQQPM